MKTRIRPYTEFLLRQNITYILAAILLLFATAGMIYYMNQQISDLNARIKKNRAEIAALTSKRTALRAVVGESSENLDQDLVLMNSLIPDSEDYFSIINALETLSRETGFHIDSYVINLLASTSNRLSLSVTGVGDSDSFLTFLKKYQLSGGRLITAENIGLDPQAIGNIRLDLNFYNKKVSGDTATDSAGIVPTLSELNAIKSKVTFSLTDNEGADRQVQEYPTKENPF
jgi:hypothetical protein